MADIVSRLPVTDNADGSTGSATPTAATLVGGTDGTDLRALSTNSSGVLNINLAGATGSGTIAALNGNVIATTGGYGTTIFNITGTWVGTLALQGNNGDGTWIGLKAYSSITGLYTNVVFTSNAESITTDSGWFQIRMIATAWTSGTATVTWGSQAYVGKQQVYQDTSGALITSAYTFDGSGNSIGSTSGSLNVDVTNTIPVSQSGTWNINNVSGTVSLPTGAATSANQTSVIGSAAGGTAATNSELVGGSYSTTLPTLTNGQQAAMQLDANGRLITAPAEVLVSGSIAGNGNILLLPNGTIPTLAPYTGMLLEISGTWSATLTVSGSNGGAYFPIEVVNLSTGNSQSTITANGLYYAPIGSVDLQFAATAYVSGSVQCYATLRSNPPPLSQPTNVATSANQTNASQKTQVVDGSGNVIASYNNELNTDDIVNTSISSGSITVGTTAVAARVGASNLTSRKQLMISPVTYTVYMGATSGVTTATGIPIYPGQVVAFAYGASVTPYLIAATSGTVNVFEGA